MAELTSQNSQRDYDSTILEMLDGCYSLYEVLVGSEDESTSEAAKAIFHALDIWTRYTGARGQKGLSLDDRLRDNTDLKGTICDLLHLVYTKLSQSKQYICREAMTVRMSYPRLT